ncbi:hypothetical protein ERJ75_001541000 [Trypanosoma vivax]|nr:hypothetical protein ERJ75_001541000 [Trypanosoma vivax]
MFAGDAVEARGREAKRGEGKGKERAGKQKDVARTLKARCARKRQANGSAGEECTRFCRGDAKPPREVCRAWLRNARGLCALGGRNRPGCIDKPPGERDASDLSPQEVLARTMAREDASARRKGQAGAGWEGEDAQGLPVRT